MYVGYLFGYFSTGTVYIDDYTKQPRKSNQLKKSTYWNHTKFLSTQGPVKSIKQVQDFKQDMYEPNLQ